MQQTYALYASAYTAYVCYISPGLQSVRMLYTHRLFQMLLGCSNAAKTDTSQDTKIILIHDLNTIRSSI